MTGQHDADIREPLRALLMGRNDGEVIDELGLTGVRADIAVIHDSWLEGFEIKSDSDSLTRLPRQVAGYSRVFRRCWLVAASGHLDAALPLLPDHWGVMRADGSPATPTIVRPAGDSPSLDAVEVASLMWRGEALAVLHGLHADRGVRSKPRRAIWDRCADVLGVTGCERAAAGVIRARGDWRARER